MSHKKMIMIVVIAAVVVVGGIVLLLRIDNQPGKLDAFAQCLKDKGAVFYGAFWCPHCQKQKVLFGSSEKLLPYVECSTADGKSQLPVCTDKKIEGYPTWEFADGSREHGEVSLETLSQKTGCVLSN